MARNDFARCTVTKGSARWAVVTNVWCLRPVQGSINVAVNYSSVSYRAAIKNNYLIMPSEMVQERKNVHARESVSILSP